MLENVADLDKKTPIVVYCSVGYRSEKVGEKLKAAGFLNVKNLYGSIFEWVNEGNPVVGNDNKATAKVHTYNKTWSRWVDKKNIEKVYWKRESQNPKQQNVKSKSTKCKFVFENLNSQVRFVVIRV